LGNFHTRMPGDVSFIRIALSKITQDGSNVHRWTVFVKTAQNQVGLENELPLLAEDLIDQVIVDLHPTFTPSRITITSPPFQLTRVRYD
jgi:transcription initiation factor IIF auxiliary subunit